MASNSPRTYSTPEEDRVSFLRPHAQPLHLPASTSTLHSPRLQRVQQRGNQPASRETTAEPPKLAPPSQLFPELFSALGKVELECTQVPGMPGAGYLREMRLSPLLRCLQVHEHSSHSLSPSSQVDLLTHQSGKHGPCQKCSSSCPARARHTELRPPQPRWGHHSARGVN